MSWRLKIQHSIHWIQQVKFIFIKFLWLNLKKISFFQRYVSAIKKHNLMRNFVVSKATSKLNTWRRFIIRFYRVTSGYFVICFGILFLYLPSSSSNFFPFNSWYLISLVFPANNKISRKINFGRKNTPNSSRVQDKDVWCPMRIDLSRD